MPRAYGGFGDLHFRSASRRVLIAIVRRCLFFVGANDNELEVNSFVISRTYIAKFQLALILTKHEKKTV